MKTRLIRRFSGWLLGALLLVPALLVSCQDDLVPAAPYLDIDQTTLIFGVNGGTQNVTFTTDRDWFLSKIETQEEWYSFSATEGPAGTATIAITVEPSSEDANARKGQLQLRASAEGAVITVIQSGVPIVTTADVISKDEVSALVKSNWVYAVDLDLQEQGVMYNAKGSSSVHTARYEPIGKGDYNTLLENLSPETEYEYKAYILTVDGKYYYGDVKSFTTDKTSTPIAIEELRALTTAQLASEFLKIECIVLNNAEHGNDVIGDSKRLFVVDKANPTKANSGIIVTLDIDNPYAHGDVLEVKLNGAAAGTANGVKQVTVNSLKVRKTGTAAVVPVAIGYGEIDNYEAMYVEIDRTQITRSFLNAVNYPTWNGAGHPNNNTTYVMEVEGNETTYGLFVDANADFAGGRLLTGSGKAKGILFRNSGSIPTLYPTKAEDLAGLAGTRFQTVLVLKFISARFSGELVAEKAISGSTVITLSYQNAEEGDVLPGPVSIEITGDGAPGITIDPKSNIALIEGSSTQTLAFEVKGTPTELGSVLFTVKGLEAYGLEGANAQVRANVVSGIPQGNFNVNWAPTSSYSSQHGASAPLAVTSNNQSALVVSPVTGYGFTGSASGHYGTTWGGVIAVDNSALNPTTYAEFSISTGSKALSVYSLLANIRRNGQGYQTCTVQYRFGSGGFTTFMELEATGNTVNFQKDLSNVAELQNIAPGTTVTFRLIPRGATASDGRWVLTGTGLSIGGNVE